MYWRNLYLLAYLLVIKAKQLRPIDFLVTIEFENNKECIGAMVDRLNVATSSMCLERYNFAKRLYPRPCKVYGGITEDGNKTVAVWRFCIGYKMNDRNFNAKIFLIEDADSMAEIYIPLIPIDIPFDSELVRPIQVLSPDQIINEQGNASCMVYGWSSNLPKRTFRYKKRDGDNLAAENVGFDQVFSSKKDGSSERFIRTRKTDDGHRRRPSKPPSHKSDTDHDPGAMEPIKPPSGQKPKEEEGAEEQDTTSGTTGSNDKPTISDGPKSYDGSKDEFPPHSLMPRDSATILVSKPATILNQKACEKDYLEFRDEILPQGQFCVVESERIADLGRILVCKDSLVGVIADDLHIRETDSGQMIYSYSSLTSSTEKLKFNMLLILLSYVLCLIFQNEKLCLRNFIKHRTFNLPIY